MQENTMQQNGPMMFQNMHQENATLQQEIPLAAQYAMQNPIVQQNRPMIPQNLLQYPMSQQNMSLMPQNIMQSPAFQQNRPMTPQSIIKNPAIQYNKPMMMQNLLPLSAEQQQAELEHTIIREQEVARITSWVNRIIKTIDEVALDKKFACQTLDIVIRKKHIVSERTKDFLEDVAAFWRHNIESGDMDKFHERSLLMHDEDLHDVKTPYQRHLKEALTHLNLIETYSGIEVKRLNKIAGKFFFSLKDDLPRKKAELWLSLKHAKKCVRKEGKKKLKYDKELNQDMRVPNLLDCCKKRSKHDRGIQTLQWHQAMAKAQYTEAVRLTDEAFDKANLNISSCQNSFRNDYNSLMKNYILIEMNQHCKALEYLTLAYKFIMGCEREVHTVKVEEETNSIDKSISETNEDPAMLASKTLDEIDKLDDENLYQIEAQRNSERFRPYGSSTPTRTKLARETVSPENKRSKSDDDESRKSVSPGYPKTLEEAMDILSKDPGFQKNRSRPTSQSKVSFSTRPSKPLSDRDEEFGEKLIQEKPHLQKYADRVKDYDDLINSNIDSFISLLSKGSPSNSFSPKTRRSGVFTRTTRSSTDFELNKQF